MTKYRSVVIFFSILLCFIFNLNASNVSIKASLDSVNLLMGNTMALHLEIVGNEGEPGYLKIFQNANPAKGFVSLCGDSVELRTAYVVDTVKIGSGRIQMNYQIPVQAFDSGTYTLPKFVYISGNDSAVSNQLTFNVIPVNVTSEDPIAGFASVEEPDGKRFYDWVPDWVLDYWWIFFIIVIAVCLFLWAMRKYNKVGLPKILSKPQPKPWEIALSELYALKERKLWEQGMEKEYFTKLTDILREYLFARFGINAMEMTTRQIMEKIHESEYNDKKDYIRFILSVADFVKFAKVRPLPADNITAFDNAVKFVNETIPVEKTPETDKESDDEEGGDVK